MKLKKVCFLGMIFCIIFSLMSNFRACDKKVLKEEIFNMCEKYNVGFCYKNPLNKETLCYNSKKRYDPASTNKTYLALCVFDMIKEKRIDISEVLTYQKHHKYGGSGKIQNGSIGDKYTVQQLLELLITQSDNIASRMLRERVGEDNLKDFLAKIGTPVTSPKCINQIFSSEDLIKHLEALYNLVSEKSVLSEKAKIYFSSGIYNDKIPAGVPSLHVLHKPGWIPYKLICNDEAIIYDKNNNPYFLAVMSQGIPEEKQSEFFKTLSSKIYDYHCCEELS